MDLPIILNFNNNKKNIELEFFRIREELAEEYLYPQFGGKDKFVKAFNEDKKKKK